jgi:hypothetical protein
MIAAATLRSLRASMSPPEQVVSDHQLGAAPTPYERHQVPGPAAFLRLTKHHVTAEHISRLHVAPELQHPAPIASTRHRSSSQMRRADDFLPAAVALAQERSLRRFRGIAPDIRFRNRHERAESLTSLHRSSTRACHRHAPGGAATTEAGRACERPERRRAEAATPAHSSGKR